MTLLIATVTPRFAAITQDSYVTADADKAKISDHACAVADFSAGDEPWLGFAGDGEPPTDRPLCFVQKVTVAGNVVLAGAGSYLLFVRWAAELAHRPEAGDVAAADRIAPERLRALRDELAIRLPTCFVHVGWSKERGRVGGFLYSSAEDFRSRPLRAGHAMSPMVAPDDPEYDDLAARWTPAALGIGTEEFHVRAAQNVYRAYRRGLYAKGAGIGGWLDTAVITADGIEVKRTNPFPDDLGRAEAR
jgi:hypothetical protein